MRIETQKSLKPYNTFGIKAIAQHFVAVSSVEQLEAIAFNDYDKILVIGGGSNLLFTQDFQGLVLKMDNRGIDIVSEDKDEVIIKIAAAEQWHDLVTWAVNNNYGGIENMALIPGSVGAAPVQNIGAYGRELKDVFISCEVWNITSKSLKIYNKQQCSFRYRDSIFKRYIDQNIITSVTLKLTKTNHRTDIGYGNIKSTLSDHKITNPTIQDIYQAVIKIRQQKLPNPDKIGNAGSFFKNPIISQSHREELLNRFPEMPSYSQPDHQYKIPAGWLIEQSGYKGLSRQNVGVYDKQALILVNNGEAMGQEIYNLSQEIIQKIQQIFDIVIEREVRVI